VTDAKINEKSLEWWMQECMRRGEKISALKKEAEDLKQSQKFLHGERMEWMRKAEGLREALKDILSVNINGESSAYIMRDIAEKALSPSVGEGGGKGSGK
jgi:hypothetical protein